MVITEAFKFVASTVLFMRTFVRVLHNYLNDKPSLPKDSVVKGVGMTQDTKLPAELPTIIDIKRALPKHCFQPNLSTSMYYAASDVIQVVLAYLAISYLQEIPWLPFQAATMILYWAIQGTLFMAIFVVGHDCGHNSFSDSSLANDLVGNILHGFLLCPFYMWKLSHRNHHRFTGNIDKDEVFYPVRRSLRDNTSGTLPGFAFGIGWFVYLARGYKPRTVHHFNPYDPLFSGHVFSCFCSLASLVGMLYLLLWFWAAHGLYALVCYYVIPLLIFASYLIVVTFLHHTEMNVPWFADDRWDFVKGQLSTIDRHYGIVHYVIHSIGTHQMHHMFTKIPHYHLEEATRHFRQAFPDLVRACDEPILPSFMRMFKKYEQQSIIDDDLKVHVYK